MKKVLSLVVAAGIIATAAASFGKSIKGSKHDLSAIAANNITLAGGVQGSSTQICIYCHAPHNAAKSLPLWNRTNTAGSSFTLYSGLNMANISFRRGFTEDSTSLFCMSCHDGLTSMADVHNAGVIAGAGGTAIDAGVDSRRTALTNVLTAGNIGDTKNAALGSYNLSKTHPINFEVSEVDTQNDLHTGTATGKMGNLNQFPLFKASAPDRTTSERYLECGSCHAVHDPAISPFLRMGMDKSDLCLACHNK